MKRAKGTAKNYISKFSRKKRFGKSIKNRCPSGFQITVEKKYKVTGAVHIYLNFQRVNRGCTIFCVNGKKINLIDL